MAETYNDTFFIFAAVQSTDFGIWILRGGVHIPLLPPTRERQVTVPTVHGRVDVQPYYDSLTITLDCQVQDSSRAALLGKLDALATLLDARAGVKPLVISDRPAKTYYARYSGHVDIAALAYAAEFSLPFTVPNPFPTIS